MSPRLPPRLLPVRFHPGQHACGVRNLLEVSFGAELGIATGGRFTVSDQIDWAPVMPTRDPTNPHR